LFENIGYIGVTAPAKIMCAGIMAALAPMGTSLSEQRKTNTGSVDYGIIDKSGYPDSFSVHILQTSAY
jgi:hypothetical protein